MTSLVVEDSISYLEHQTHIDNRRNAAMKEPDPKPGGEVVLTHVIRDLQDRAEMGIRKYGTYLRTGNGRDALMDAYQEALDLVMYLRQSLLEREDGK